MARHHFFVGLIVETPAALTSVLHTWGSAMTHHPHVHMIVPGGGISLDGARWISSAEDNGWPAGPNWHDRDAHRGLDGLA